jgi:hypothetical protein
MPLDDEMTNSAGETPFVLPKHVRFARSLALVSGAVIGLAAGAVVFGAGCGSNGTSACYGTNCGLPGVQPTHDAHFDTKADLAAERADGSADAREVGSDGHGGGPTPSPHLPADWLT